jgi:hypothetical protein
LVRLRSSKSVVNIFILLKKILICQWFAIPCIALYELDTLKFFLGGCLQGSLCHLRPPVNLKNLGREIRGQCFSTDSNTKTVPVAVISTHKVMAVNVGALLKVIFFLSPNGLSA